MCIFASNNNPLSPPSSGVVNLPMILGWGIADLTARHCWYKVLSFLLFFVSVYIWISSAKISSRRVPFFWSSVPSSFWHAWCSWRKIRVSLANSLRSSHNFASLRLVFVHNRLRNHVWMMISGGSVGEAGVDFVSYLILCLFQTL